MNQSSYMMSLSGFDSPNQQMGGFLDDIKNWGQNLVTEYVDDPLRELGASVGLSQAEIDRIASETNKAYQQELINQQQQLLAQITGQTQPTQTNSTITNLQNQIANLTAQLDKSVPGGMTTVYAIGGLVGGFALYKIFMGPKTK